MEMITRMIRISKKLALAAGLTAVVVGLGTGVAFAAGDTDDNINPASTNYTATNSTNIVFKGKINGIAITVTCRNSSITGETPASGLGPANVNNPSFTLCTDNFGGNDTVTTNNTNGPWKVTFLDSPAADEETETEPNSGDQLQVTIPKAGAKFTSSVIPGCTVTVAPSGPASVIGPYDDVSALSFSNANVSVGGTGCTASSPATLTGSYTITTSGGGNLEDVS